MIVDPCVVLVRSVVTGGSACGGKNGRWYLDQRDGEGENFVMGEDRKGGR